MNEDAELIAADKLQQATKIALLVSPMISCEDAWLLGQLVLSIDANAIIGIGPVEINGKDKTFPSGFTVRAEKAPNVRGIRRALGDSLAYDDWKNQMSNADTVVVTGNYPEQWQTPEISDSQTLILIDTLLNDLTDRCDVFLPGATWAEKAGTFENCNNVLYREGGIRTSEIGSVMFGQQPDGSEKFADKELVRLAFPRRVYTQSHIDYVVEVLEYINTMKDSIKGVRITKQQSRLRHFTAKFEIAD